MCAHARPRGSWSSPNASSSDSCVFLFISHPNYESKRLLLKVYNYYVASMPMFMRGFLQSPCRG
jgi:hypothetical protein